MVDAPQQSKPETESPEQESESIKAPESGVYFKQEDGSYERVEDMKADLSKTSEEPDEESKNEACKKISQFISAVTQMIKISCDRESEEGLRKGFELAYWIITNELPIEKQLTPEQIMKLTKMRLDLHNALYRDRFIFDPVQQTRIEELNCAFEEVARKALAVIGQKRDRAEAA